MGGEGTHTKARHTSERVPREARRTQPQRSEDAGGGRKGEKLTNPAKRDKNSPVRGKPLCRGRSARGRDDRADRQGGQPTRPTKRAAAGEGAGEGSPAGANDSPPANERACERGRETGKPNRYLPNQGRAPKSSKKPQATGARNANKEGGEPSRPGHATIAAAPRSGQEEPRAARKPLAAAHAAKERGWRPYPRERAAIMGWERGSRDHGDASPARRPNGAGNPIPQLGLEVV